MMIIRRAINPFEKPLWNDRQLKLITRGVLMNNREGSELYPEDYEQITKLVSELQGNYQVPFDELYHKERGLIQAVIEADRALKQKEATLKDIFSDRFISRQEVHQVDPNSILGS
jgi:hypothetical protein